jgi:UDP-galactopyranose mutase
VVDSSHNDSGPGVVIVGAGIAGLSLAYHLKLPYDLYEKEETVGGICRSEVVAGCTFDYAPKVMLLGNQYATDLSVELLGENVQFTAFSDWSYHHRYGVYTRTPFQKHMYGLPTWARLRALAGLATTKLSPNGKDHKSYQDWLYSHLGRPIADMVIVPQESKKWKINTAEMDYRWAPSRVPRPDLKTALRGAVQDIPQSREFGYTLRGGIQALMDGFAERLAGLHLGVSLEAVDTTERVVHFDDGTEKPYDALVGTLPLPLLVNKLDRAPNEVREAASRLKTLSLLCVCLVVEREPISDKHFVYVHDPDLIFHRVSFLSNLSPEMAPPGYSSVIAEVSYVDEPPMSEAALIERVQADLTAMNVLRPEDHIVGSRILYLPHAYPRQTPDRLDNVRLIRDCLEKFDIYSFGRFGEWEYYNMHDIIPNARDFADELEKRYG